MLSKTIKLISLGSSSRSSLIISRNYAVKTDLKVKWIRPEKISCIKPERSGDLAKFEYPQQQRLLSDFDKSEELKSASELVKKLFTLEQNRRKGSVDIVIKETVDKVKRHDLDMGSLESKSKELTTNDNKIRLFINLWIISVATQTAQIRAMQEYMEKFPRNKVVKVQL